jgi:hypothetical protein
LHNADSHSNGDTDTYGIDNTDSDGNTDCNTDSSGTGLQRELRHRDGTCTSRGMDKCCDGLGSSVGDVDNDA